LFLISIPLFYTTVSGARFLYDEKRIRSFVQESAVLLDVEIDKLKVSKFGEGYKVTGNILIYDDPNVSDDFSKIKTSIEKIIDKPVVFDIRTLNASKLTF